MTEAINNSYASLGKFQRFYFYFLVLGLMAISAFPLFMGKNQFLGYFAILMVGVVIYKPNIKKYLGFLAFYALILLAQLLKFGSIYVMTAVMQFLSVLAAVLCFAVVSINFIPIFQKLMYWICIISLVLFLPLLVYPGFSDIMLSKFPIHVTIVNEIYGNEEVVHNFLFINYPSDFIYKVRNAGPFWEPAVFGGSLLISFAIAALEKRTIFSKHGFVVMATILTTFSTTTYLALLLFITFFYTFKIKSIILRVGLMLGCLIGFFYIYSTVDFLGDKINEEFNEVSFDVVYQGGNSRMASAYLDLVEVTETNFYFLFGRGGHPEFRVSTADKNVLRNNGLTDQLALWGIPFFIFFFYHFRKSWAAFCRVLDYPAGMSYFLLAIIWVISFSEPYYRYPFIWAMALFGFTYDTYLDEKRRTERGQVLSRPQPDLTKFPVSASPQR